MGVSDRVSHAVSQGPFWHRCPKSVQRVSRECPWSVKKVSGHSGDTLGTLFGHSGARCQKGPRDTLSDTPSDTPHFRGHFVGHSPGHFGPEGPGRLLCLLGEFAILAKLLALSCRGFFHNRRQILEAHENTPAILSL